MVAMITRGIEANNFLRERFILRINDMIAVNRNKKIPKNENRLKPSPAVNPIAMSITKTPKGIPYLIAFRNTLSEICSDSDVFELSGDKMATSTNR